MNANRILRIYHAADLPRGSLLLALFLGSCFLLSALELIGLASIVALLAQMFGDNETVDLYIVEFDTMASAAVFILVVWIGRSIAIYGLSRYNHKFIQKIKSGLQRRQFEVAFATRKRSDQMETGKLFTALTNEVQMITGQVFTPMSIALAEVMLVTLFFIVSLFIMPLGVLLAGGTVLVGYLITSRIINPIARNLGKKRLSAERYWTEKVVNMFSLRREAEVYGVSDVIKSDLISEVVRSNDLSGKFYSIAPLNRAVLETFGVFAIIGLLLFAQHSQTPNEHIMFVIVALVRMLPSATRILAAIQSYRFATPVIDKQLNYLAGDASGISTTQDDDSRRIKIDANLLTYRFGNGIEPSEIPFSLDTHGLVVVSGESGLGKTTMLDEMVDFLLHQRSINHQYAKEFSYASQNNLVTETNINQNLDFYRGQQKDRLNQGVELLRSWGFSEDHFSDHRRASDFSGGEKKRVTVARALNCTDAIIILDEPTAGLNRSIADKVIATICEKAKRSLVIVVTHDDHLINCADQTFNLKR